MKYRTIVADPPWDYTPKRGGNDTAIGYSPIGPKKASMIPYQAMSIEEIAQLPVSDLAAPSARVFLWTTNTHLPDSFDVLTEWGFRYAQTLVWHKPNASPFSGSVAIGSAEFLLVGVRGSVKVLNKANSSVLKIGHHHDHSRKPEAFLDLIEQVSPGPYLELFARRNRLGWDTWGDEALGHVEVVS